MDIKIASIIAITFLFIICPFSKAFLLILISTTNTETLIFYEDQQLALLVRNDKEQEPQVVITLPTVREDDVLQVGKRKFVKIHF